MSTSRVLIDILVSGKTVASIPRANTGVLRMDDGLSVFLSSIGSLIRISGPDIREVIEALEAGDNIELTKAGQLCVIQLMTNKDVWNEGSDSSLRKIFMVNKDEAKAPEKEDPLLTPKFSSGPRASHG